MKGYFLTKGETKSDRYIQDDFIEKLFCATQSVVRLNHAGLYPLTRGWDLCFTADI